MMEKTIDANLIGNYIIDYAISSEFTFKHRYHMDFGNPELYGSSCSKIWLNIPLAATT